MLREVVWSIKVNFGTKIVVVMVKDPVSSNLKIQKKMKRKGKVYLREIGL